MHQIESEATLLLYPGDRLSDQKSTVIAQKDLDDDPNSEQGEQQGNHHLDKTYTSLVMPRCALHSSVLTIKACWAGSPA